MSYTTTHHPTEEALCDCALHECDEELLKHIEQCVQCSEYVEGIRSISHDIASIKDEPVPERLNAAIMAITRCKEKSRIVTVVQTWYKNPFVIGILTIGLILLLYAVYMMAV
jgi:hypothetical protein